jgi:hypothetical protein
MEREADELEQVVRLIGRGVGGVGLDLVAALNLVDGLALLGVGAHGVRHLARVHAALLGDDAADHPRVRGVQEVDGAARRPRLLRCLGRHLGLVGLILEEALRVFC